jgi:hypothetical protein
MIAKLFFLISIALWPQTSPQKPVYSYDARLLERPGVQPFWLATSWQFFDYVDGQYDLTQVSKAAIARSIARYKDEQGPVLLDIENFDLGSNNLEAHYYAAWQFAIVAQQWKTQSRRQIGFYFYWRDYWTPVALSQALRGESGRDIVESREKFSAWQAKNERIATVIRPLIDYACLSVYALYPGENAVSQARWREYCEANLRELKRCYPDVPRYAIIQPNYPDGTPFEPAKWEMMVQFLRGNDNIDGIFVYSRNENPGPPGWRDMLAPDPAGTSDGATKAGQ